MLLNDKFSIPIGHYSFKIIGETITNSIYLLTHSMFDSMIPCVNYKSNRPLQESAAELYNVNNNTTNIQGI